MPNEILINGKPAIGADQPPFVIAEMSGNHNGSLERALALVDAAAASGCQALKIQTYTADTMTLDVREREFLIDDATSLWAGYALYDLYKKAYTPWEWHEAIFRRCREKGIIGFSTPFDATAVDFLESLGASIYKIASFENVDLPLIRRVAATGKPMIISTGLASVDEIGEAVDAARGAGCKDLVLLKCTSSYPASPKNSNLRAIPVLASKYGVWSGLSDHTLGIGAAVASVAFGSVVIEKHFTLARKDGGVDSAFSLEPAELTSLVEESERAWQALGEELLGPGEDEKKSLQFRRSLYIAEDISAGDTLTAKNLRAVRPGRGLAPKFYEGFLGRTVVRAARKGTPVDWDLLSPKDAESVKKKHP